MTTRGGGPSVGPTPAASEDGFRPDIEGLRGVAVTLVVLYHAGLLAVSGGFIGVDVFFVISGYLITGLLLREVERRGTVSFRNFYARRVRRLAPAGIVVLVVTLVVTAILANPLDRPALLLDGAASALSVGNFRFAAAASDYFTAVTTPSPFLHFWSLAVEEQFYLVWPALLVAAVAVAGQRHGRTAIGATLAVVCVASFALSVVVTNIAVGWAFYSLPTRAWQLAAGGLLAIWAVPLARLPDRLRAVAGAGGVAAILLSAWLLDGSVAYPGIAALVPTLGSVGVLLAAGRGPASLLTLAPVRFVGRISYSLYLWHWPLLVLPVLATSSQPPAAASAALVVVAIVAATLSWRYVETPFRTGFGGRLSRRPGAVLGTGLATLLIVALVSGGMAWRDGRVLAADGGVPAGSVASLPPGGASGSSGPDGSPGPSSSGPASTPVSYALPADLRPTPAGARADTTEALLRADGCMGTDLDSDPPACVYGDRSGTFTLALVGDSHAAQWFTALDAIATARGWRLETFTKVRCPFLDIPMQNVAFKREYTECEAWDRAVIGRLQSTPPDLTLISIDRNWIKPTDPAQDSPEAEGASEARLVAQIPGRVGVIVDTPIADKDVPVCLATHTADYRPCAFSRAVGAVNAMGVRESIVAAETGAGLIDLNDRICPGDPCQPIQGSFLIYRDNSHLTATFSLQLVPDLTAAIDRLLASPQPSAP